MQISEVLNRLSISGLSDYSLISILEGLDDAIYVTGKYSELIYINKAAEDLFGFTFSEMIGKKNSEINVNFKYWYPSVLSDVYAEKKKVTQEQWSAITGKRFHTTLVPVMDKNDEVVMIVALSRKISYSVETTSKEFEGFYYKSPKMLEVFRQIDKVLNLDKTVLLTGETGTGKNKIAKYIHKQSDRKDKPFIMVNCATIASNIIETELFGYEPYTFSGANPKGKKGIIESAEGGTIFLDEIDELSLKVQPKILEFIQNGTYRKVGGRECIRSNARVLVATNKNLLEEAGAKRFRHDLYYRLSVLEIEIPPLRDRVLDIRALSDHFIERNNEIYNTNKKLALESYDLLEKYSWPGNVRQLKNFFEKTAITIDSDIIYPHHISFLEEKREFLPKKEPIELEIVLLDEKLKELEKAIVTDAYLKYKSQRLVAKALGISKTKAHRLINLYCSDK